MEWSQDGTKLLASGSVALEKPTVWMISVIGATLEKLRDDARDASLSPDGSQIVFTDTNTREIWLIPTARRDCSWISQAGTSTSWRLRPMGVRWPLVPFKTTSTLGRFNRFLADEG